MKKEHQLGERANNCGKPVWRHGILKILSKLAEAGIRTSVPLDLLKVERYDEPKYQEAAVIIRFAQSSLSSDEARGLAKITSELIEDQSQIIDFVLNTIKAHKMTGSEVEIFLIELSRWLLNTRWRTAGQVIQTLDDFLRQRNSNLVEIWAELGLPEGLSKLIRTDTISA